MLELQIDRLLTSFYGIWDSDVRTLTYQAAGHPPPIWFHASGEAEVCEAGRTSILGIPGLAPSQLEHSIELQPGDSIAVFTDGLFEAPRRTIDDGLESVMSIGSASAATSAAQLADHLMNEARPPGGWLDDVALLVATAPAS